MSSAIKNLIVSQRKLPAGIVAVVKVGRSAGGFAGQHGPVVAREITFRVASSANTFHHFN